MTFFNPAVDAYLLKNIWLLLGVVQLGFALLLSLRIVGSLGVLIIQAIVAVANKREVTKIDFSFSYIYPALFLASGLFFICQK